MHKSICFFEDCNLVMPRYSDKYFDWAICDIPYGIDVGNMAYIKEQKTTVKQKNGTRLNPRKKNQEYTLKDWDKQVPDQAYFKELCRISKNQIIFGVEYVDWTGLGDGRIKWNKGVADGMSFKKYELAYCSSIDHTYEINLLWTGMQQAESLQHPMRQQGNKQLNEKRIHPTHKPILLYKKLILDFGFKGMKVFDSHLGGGSNRIANYNYASEFVSCEIDKQHFEDQEIRFKNFTNNLQLSFD